MRKLLSALFLFAVMQDAHAQQDMLYSLFPENRLFHNAAYAGVSDHGVLNASARNQWPNLPYGHPVSFLLSYDQNLDSIRSGVGIVLGYEEAGFSTHRFAGLNYSYSWSISRSFQLRAGTQLSLQEHTFDFSQLVSNGPTGLPSTLQSEIKPDIDAGIWLYVPGKLHLGISAKHLLEPRFEKVYYTSRRHYYFMTGYEVPLNIGAYRINAEASGIWRVAGYSQALDLNLRFTMRDWLTAGVSYRPDNTNSIIVHGGVLLLHRLKISAAYDFGNTSLGDSYEGNIKYLFIKRKPKPEPPKKKAIKLKPMDEE